jgi:hypothetical protein
VHDLVLRFEAFNRGERLSQLEMDAVDDDARFNE